WCGDASSEEQLKKLSVTIRCLPYDQDGKEGVCVITGKPATVDAIFAKAY
ncbi:MAG: proline--tRNA ligase, partial [Rhodospirillaceae bacterium]|nr:proline--tRNA ligase [Rhodospirillaceae bacterium]